MLPTVLQSAVTMPTKNFFPSSLTPTCSSQYPFLYSICKTPIPDFLTGMSLNCNPLTYSPIPDSLTGTSLNCNFAQTLHDMPSSHVEHVGHLSTQMDDMPSSNPDTLLSYWLDDMPSSHLDYFGHFDLLSHLGHPDLLGHLSYLSTIGNLNTLNPEPIDAPLHTFIEEEPT
jgi:hypothetical protein